MYPSNSFPRHLTMTPAMQPCPSSRRILGPTSFLASSCFTGSMFMKPFSLRLIHILVLALVLGAASLPVGAQAPERITADSPKTTVAGNTFIAPAGWSLVIKGPATILEAPEGGSFIALIDVPVKDAKTADDALAAAWKVYKPDATWPMRVATPIADKDG